MQPGLMHEDGRRVEGELAREAVVRPLALPLTALWDADYRCWETGHTGTQPCVWSPDDSEALLDAAEKGDAAEVKRLIAAKVDVNGKDGDGPGAYDY